MMNYIKRMFNEIFHQMKLLHEENDYIIKKEDEIIEEGIRLTMCFKDIKQGYYVRKTYVMENDLWYHEELYVVPLTKF